MQCTGIHSMELRLPDERWHTEVTLVVKMSGNISHHIWQTEWQMAITFWELDMARLSLWNSGYGPWFTFDFLFIPLTQDGKFFDFYHSLIIQATFCMITLKCPDPSIILHSVFLLSWALGLMTTNSSWMFLLDGVFTANFRGLCGFNHTNLFLLSLEAVAGDQGIHSLVSSGLAPWLVAVSLLYVPLCEHLILCNKSIDSH